MILIDWIVADGLEMNCVKIEMKWIICNTFGCFAKSGIKDGDIKKQDSIHFIHSTDLNYMDEMHL